MNVLKKLSQLLLISIFALSSIAPSFFPFIAEAATAPALLKDVDSRTYGSDARANIEFDGKLWSVACTNDNENCNFYTSDGTEGNFEKFTISDNGEEILNADPGSAAVIGSTMYFAANNADGDAVLWKTDGTEEGTEVAASNFRYPVYLTEFNGNLYFSAEDNDTGRELWKFDGDTASQIADINPSYSSSDPYGFVVFDNKLHFIARQENDLYDFHPNNEGYAIYRVNDTEDGVVVVEDFIDFKASPDTYLVHGPEHMDVHSGVLYFSTYEDTPENSGFHLYKLVDQEGQWVPEHITQMSEQSCEFGDGAYLECWDGFPAISFINGRVVYGGYTDDGFKMYTSDGTTIGTTELVALPDGVSDVDIIYTDASGEPGYIYYTHSSNGTATLRITDGVSFNVVIDSLEGNYNDDAALIGSDLYLTICPEGEDFEDCELYRVNDAVDGVDLIKDIRIGEQPSNPEGFFAFEGKIYFTANDGVHGYEMWVTDGTTGGTELLKDADEQSLSSLTDNPDNDFVEAGDYAFFAAKSETGDDLWKTDGTPGGTVKVKDINPGFEGEDSPIAANVERITAVGEVVYFVATDEGYGSELWVSDGTEDGTEMVEDIASDDSSSFPTRLTAVGESLYFVADAGDGNNLYYIANLGASVQEVAAGFTNLDQMLVSFNDALYFYGEDEGVKGIYKIVGAGSPTLIHDLSAGFLSTFMKSNENLLYYTAVDGTNDGLFRITKEDEVEYAETEDSELGSIRRGGFAGDTLVLFGGSVGLTVTVVPPAGTRQSLASYESDPSSVDDVATIGDDLFYIVQSGAAFGLWKTDGTVDGTVRLGDGEDWEDSNLRELVAGGDTVYFVADSQENGTELWRSDGTVDGTVLVADIYPGTYEEDGDEYPNSGSPSRISVFGSTLLFYADDGVHGEEPWYISGLTLLEEEEPEEEEPNEEEPEGEQSSGGSRGGSSTRRAAAGQTPVSQVQIPAIVTAPTPAFTRDLGVGSSGSDVKELQKFLNSQGFVVALTGPGSVGNETDTFGNATKAALAKFQAANGIVPAAGYLGPVTRAFIASMGGVNPVGVPSVPVSVSEGTSAPSFPLSVRDLDTGMSGDDVKALQLLLIAQGYSIPAGPTGFFATQTKTALAKYQSEHGIVPSIGYFGAITRTEMKGRGLEGLWW